MKTFTTSNPRPVGVMPSAISVIVRLTVVLTTSVVFCAFGLARAQDYQVELSAKQRMQMIVATLEGVINHDDPILCEDLAAVTMDLSADDIAARAASIRDMTASAAPCATIHLKATAYRTLGDGLTATVRILCTTPAGGVADSLTLGLSNTKGTVQLIGLSQSLDYLNLFASSERLKTAIGGASSTKGVRGERAITNYESDHLLRPIDLYSSSQATMSRLTLTTSVEQFDGPIVNRPMGVASFYYEDPNPNFSDYKLLVVADANWDRILVGEPEKGWLRSIGGFRCPMGVAYAGWQFYVADMYAGAVQQYDVQTQYDPPHIVNRGPLAYPWDKPVDVTADLFKCSGGNGQDYYYSYCAVLDQEQGKVRHYGRGCDSLGDVYPTSLMNLGLSSPTSLCFGRNKHTQEAMNRIYVADAGNRRVISFVPTQPYGPYPRVSQTEPDAFPADAYITSVCVDDHGHVYAVDAKNSQIRKFTPGLSLVAVFGSSGDGADELLFPNRLSMVRSVIGGQTYSPHDMGQAIVTEFFGPNTGVRRYVQGFDVLDSYTEYTPSQDEGGWDWVTLHWYQTGPTVSQLHVYDCVDNGPDSLLWSSEEELALTGQCNQVWILPVSFPDTCSLILRLELASHYDHSYQVTLQDTISVDRYVVPPDSGHCPASFTSLQLVDSVQQDNPAMCAFASLDRAYKAVALATPRFAPDIDSVVDRYNFYRMEGCGVAMALYAPNDTLFITASSSIGTDSNWCWVKFPAQPAGWLPASSRRLVRVEMIFRDEYDRTATRDVDSCGVGYISAPVYWSWCQSPCADSCGICGEACTDCCTGWTVGNVDESTDHLVTMSDLTVLLDHLFVSMAPLQCPTQGNCDMSADGEVTMGDLTIMLNYLYIDFQPLPPCPY